LSGCDGTGKGATSVDNKEEKTGRERGKEFVFWFLLRVFFGTNEWENRRKAGSKRWKRGGREGIIDDEDLDGEGK